MEIMGLPAVWVNDTLNGLSGSDRYVFADGWGTDTVADTAEMIPLTSQW
jgi:hypothetical protein